MGDEEGSHHDEERFLWREGDVEWIVAPGSPQQKARRKYKPLNELLTRAVKGDIREIQMKFGELEILLGDQLPESARSDSAWWTDTPENLHAEAWREPGWRVDEVDLVDEQVVFRKNP